MGWGPFSSVASFYTYYYPDAPTSVTTAYNNMNIRISWVAPVDNYKPIEDYQILILNSVNSTYY